MDDEIVIEDLNPDELSLLLLTNDGTVAFPDIGTHKQSHDAFLTLILSSTGEIIQFVVSKCILCF
ncbi:MAG: hypothetical protein JWQ66_142 [Mucilaginibacter sp.]|nr:hypothetical protein [Mucilaginibacter sp.]